MPKAKLLFVVEHFRMAGAGAENDAVSLCRALAARGYEVHAVADTVGDVPGVTVHEGLSGLAAVRADVAPDLVIDWAFLCRADVHRLGGGIHRAFLGYNLQTAPRALRWLKRLTYLTGKHRREIRRETELLHNPGATFLAISQFVADQAVAAGAAPASVCVLHNGVDTTRFSPTGAAAHREAIRAEWGAAPAQTVFLFIAHNLRLKNLALLRRVFDRVSAAGSAVKLVVVGKRRPAFRAPYLVYAGTTASIEQFYAAADALLHPSFFDSFGNVVLEAMSCGLPVAVSDCCGVSELVTDGEDGRILPVGDGSRTAAAWQGVVERWTGDRELRQLLGGAARHTAAQHSLACYVERVDRQLSELHGSSA